MIVTSRRVPCSPNVYVIEMINNRRTFGWPMVRSFEEIHENSRQLEPDRHEGDQ